jgi:hypothetical protein
MASSCREEVGNQRHSVEADICVIAAASVIRDPPVPKVGGSIQRCHPDPRQLEDAAMNHAQDHALNWRRIAAVSLTMSAHLLLVGILMLPPAPAQLVGRVAQIDTPVIFTDPPPPPPMPLS